MSGEWQELVERVMRDEPVGRNPGFKPQRIVITKGCYDRPHWRAFVEKVCAAFPDAQVDEQLALNHMEVRPTGGDRERRALGKQTLVLGTIESAVRRSAERGIACPNYWHFSTTAFCWYDCAYCYLAGSCSTVVAPTVKVFVNLEHILSQLQRRIAQQTRPTSFYLGKLQDALSLDWLTGYSKALVPFFAAQDNGRLVMLTKSACVDRLLGLRHSGHTVVSWSINPEAICRQFEAVAPSPAERLSAAQRCAKAG
ncbi:MAG: hypothetical protein FJ272_01255, partial [Planctomycetes bacterium]|nr:hypothetical protein [Planctomycetota bacterium]